MGKLYLGATVLRLRNSGLFRDVQAGSARLAASKIVALAKTGTNFTMLPDGVGLYDEGDVARVIKAAR